ncbi:MAG: hypothetical protein ACI9YT_000427 [Halobacteriales archaeon]|jgi:hypothetical protein
MGVTENDELRPDRSPEHGEGRFAAVLPVSKGDSGPCVLEGPFDREALAEGRVVGVAVNCVESGRHVANRLENGLGREIAGVNDAVGGPDDVEQVVGQLVGVAAVGVRQNDEHGRPYDGQPLDGFDATTRNDFPTPA